MRLLRQDQAGLLSQFETGLSHSEKAVERCLACEAVASSTNDGAGLSIGRALVCEKLKPRHRAWIACGNPSRCLFAHHGLASEARSTVAHGSKCARPLTTPGTDAYSPAAPAAVT